MTPSLLESEVSVIVIACSDMQIWCQTPEVFSKDGQSYRASTWIVFNTITIRILTNLSAVKTLTVVSKRHHIDIICVDPTSIRRT